MNPAKPLQAASNTPSHPEIPWMKRWEKKPAPERAAEEDDLAERLVRIDYIAMLEEIRL